MAGSRVALQPFVGTSHQSFCQQEATLPPSPGPSRPPGSLHRSRLMVTRTLAFALCVIFSAAVQAGSTGPDIDKVNGSIRIDEGQLAGDLETVNGSIHLAHHAKADS